MSPICLSAERCGGEDTVTATQVEPRPQEGQIKGAVHLKSNTTCSLLTLLLNICLICLPAWKVTFMFCQSCSVMWNVILVSDIFSSFWNHRSYRSWSHRTHCVSCWVISENRSQKHEQSEDPTQTCRFIWKRKQRWRLGCKHLSQFTDPLPASTVICCTYHSSCSTMKDYYQH